jgi:hypothetical protein
MTTDQRKIRAGVHRWVPIIGEGDDLALRAWEAIDAIAQAIDKRDYPSPNDKRFRLRNCDESLLYGYLALAKNDQEWLSRTIDSLNAAIEVADAMRSNPGLFGGLAGLGWTVEHLTARLAGALEEAATENIGHTEGIVGETGDRDILEALDATLLRLLRGKQWRYGYDLISGLVGVGIYLIERWPKPAASEGIPLVLHHIEAAMERTASGFTWHTPPDLLPEWQRQLYPQGYYNLGVAHGVPGIIHFLSQLVSEGIQAQRALALLNPAMDWLIAQRRPEGALSWFGSFLAHGESTDSRFAWCYGDLGILGVLLQVARNANRSDWREFALGLLEHCLGKGENRAGINDAPICHGAAGPALVFCRLFQSEGDPRCRDKALFWLDRTLAMRTPGQGVGGYLAFTMPEPGATGTWEPSPAFLDGAIGIALTLLAALTPVEPQWDRMLLLSTSGKAGVPA